MILSMDVKKLRGHKNRTPLTFPARQPKIVIKPNEGRIFLDDIEITHDSMYKRAQKGIGYLAQEASVFRKLSVEDNIMSVLQFTDLSKKDQKEKLELQSL